jgi:hypothetical protein
MVRAIILITLLAAIGCGGTGGAADPRSAYGTLVECEEVEENSLRGVYERREFAPIPASPGEALTITACDNYNILDGVEREPDYDEECVTDEYVAKGDTFSFFCRALIDDPEFGVFEYGFEEVYVRRNAE